MVCVVGVGVGVVEVVEDVWVVMVVNNSVSIKVERVCMVFFWGVGC